MARTVSLESKVFASAGIKVNPDNDTSAGADLLTIPGGHIDAQGPYSSHVNFIENRQDALLNEVEKDGFLEWSPLTTYSDGGFCKVGHQVYQSIEPDNINNDPLGGEAPWVAVPLGNINEALVTPTGSTTPQTIADWLSGISINADAISANSSAIASLSVVTATAFVKSDGSHPAWAAPTATTLETASDLALVVGSTIVEIVAGAPVTLPALSAGTDYTIYASDAGALQAVDADSAAPAGERVVGGFHASAGASEIVTRSFWDLNWRPKSNPRGMTLDPGGSVWGDIYLTDVEYAIFGYSRNGQTIADDGNRPILPATVGGDGTAVCPSASWWQFLDIFMAAGKRYAIYEELVSLAYGVVERQAVGTDPVTTQHQAGHRSACGCEQITGVMYQWFSGASATAGSVWNNIAEGRGDIYASNLKAPRFGASWSYGSNAGSRASDWGSAPDVSYGVVGARAVSDHLNLQAER